MGDQYLFAEQATIHDVVEYQRKQAQRSLEELPPQKILSQPFDALINEMVERFRLDVPTLDLIGIKQLPNEEVDIDVSGDFRRHFSTPGPHYIKGTALRLSIPFKGEAALLKYGTSPFNNPIPAEVRGDTIVLSYIAEHPDPVIARSEFDNSIKRIENVLRMAQDVTDEWNRQLPNLVRSRLEQRRSKLERDKALTIGYPLAPPKTTVTPPETKPVRREPHQYDLFLSHASEDKDAIARPLYTALVAAGVSVWFDEAVLELGDSLRRKIDEGLARCRYGVVILSPRFLAKQWPQRELDGLVARETASGEKAILPIWHELNRDTLMRYSPPLADRLAGRSDEGVPALVEKILRVLKK